MVHNSKGDCKMRNTFKLFGEQSRILCVISLLAVLAFSMAACDTGFGGESGGAGTDPALNGTWVLGWSLAITFKNGNWEEAYGDKPIWKGTYTTNDNRLTMTLTHINGNHNGFAYSYNLVAGKWYSRAELRALGVSEDDLRHQFDNNLSIIYSISGNTLYWTENGETDVFYKR
jgi:predicted small secreted protein